MTAIVVAPPSDPQALEEIEAAITKTSADTDLRDAFVGTLRALADGSSVRIEPMPTLLTTSQAAELLNISRTTMAKMLEDGKLPYEQPNVHRLIRLDDVLDYKQRRSTNRAAFLRESMRQAQEDGTFDLAYEEYAPALERARSNAHS